MWNLIYMGNNTSQSAACQTGAYRRGKDAKGAQRSTHHSSQVEHWIIIRSPSSGPRQMQKTCTSSPSESSATTSGGTSALCEGADEPAGAAEEVDAEADVDAEGRAGELRLRSCLRARKPRKRRMAVQPLLVRKVLRWTLTTQGHSSAEPLAPPGVPWPWPPWPWLLMPPPPGAPSLSSFPSAFSGTPQRSRFA